MIQVETYLPCQKKEAKYRFFQRLFSADFSDFITSRQQLMPREMKNLLRHNTPTPLTPPHPRQKGALDARKDYIFLVTVQMEYLQSISKKNYALA